MSTVVEPKKHRPEGGPSTTSPEISTYRQDGAHGEDGVALAPQDGKALDAPTKEDADPQSSLVSQKAAKK